MKVCLFAQSRDLQVKLLLRYSCLDVSGSNALLYQLFYLGGVAAGWRAFLGSVVVSSAIENADKLQSDIPGGPAAAGLSLGVKLHNSLKIYKKH